MFFISTFLRSSFSLQALGQSSLTIFLLSSALCLLVSSHKIDDSCKSYKGEDITEDIERAISEMKEMAHNAYIASHSEAIGFPEARTTRLLDQLFGTDRRRHSTVVDLFERIATLSPTADFFVICDDQGVQWEPDLYTQTPDPKGIWTHSRYHWIAEFDNYSPCDPARKPGGFPGTTWAFTLLDRLIYLCPVTLDMDLGRSLAPYKDQELAGRYIDDYTSLPVVLFHELLHTKDFDLIDAEVRDFPSQEDIINPNIDVYDPAYLSRLPITHAYGFTMCMKLAIDSPDLAVRNCDSLAICALALYLHMNDWGVEGDEGIGTPL